MVSIGVYCFMGLWSMTHIQEALSAIFTDALFHSALTEANHQQNPRVRGMGPSIAGVHSQEVTIISQRNQLFHLPSNGMPLISEGIAYSV